MKCTIRMIRSDLCQQQVTSRDITCVPSNSLCSSSDTFSNNRTHLPYGTAVTRDPNIDQEGE